MAKKKYIKQFISITFTDRKNAICGYVIDCNEEWFLMKHNPHDYVIAGYIIVRNHKIGNVSRGIDEKWVEKVLKLKGLEPTDNELIPLLDLETILVYLTDNFGIFQLSTKDEDVCYLGRLKSINDRNLVIDCLDTKGNWDGETTFSPNEIRMIEFDTDYTNSLKLIVDLNNND